MKPEEITVWIPTCKRPQLLKTALRSVAEQTSRQLIREIIVIENGSDRSSEAICAGFADLPIKYIYREIPLAPGSIESVESTEELLRTLDTDLLAILFDDDWWAPNHLERAVEGLREVPDAVASCCSILHTTGENDFLSHVQCSFVPWFASGGRQTSGRRILGLPDVIVGSLIATPVHFSTMVVRRAVYLKSLAAFKEGNPYDTDRTIAVELACHGKLLCDSIPTAFVRLHESREMNRLNEAGEGQRWWDRTTQWIVELARERGIDIREEFAERLKATGVSGGQLKWNSSHGSVDYLMEHDFLDAEMAAWLKNDSLQGGVKNALKNVTPPFIWELRRKGNQILGSLIRKRRMRWRVA